MRRRILSMFLAVMLVMTMTVTAFAYSYTDYAAHNGDMVEVNARCGGASCRASTYTMSSEYTVSVYVAIYFASDPSVIAVTIGGEPMRYAAVENYESSYHPLHHITATHRAGGEVIYAKTLYPSE